jgi:hypothetical protein
MNEIPKKNMKAKQTTKNAHMETTLSARMATGYDNVA